MIKVRLLRQESGDQGTFGMLFVAEMSFFTGELPWRQNAPSISCIPEGAYPCEWNMSSKFHRRMYLINGVPDRAGIRIHPANYMGDASLGWKCQLNGCIALGERIGQMKKQKALLDSANAVHRFEALMGEAPFILEVLGVSGL